MLAVLNLRRGEIDNCVMHHNREMCLFPLSRAARHQQGDGARQAVEHFTQASSSSIPDNLEVRWLLNVAAMTVGAYPDGRPGALRGSGPAAFQSAEDPGRFWDVAAPAGLARNDNAGGSVADDFDGDGLLDLVVSSRDPCEPLRLYRNHGDGTFEDVTEKRGPARPARRPQPRPDRLRQRRPPRRLRPARRLGDRRSGTRCCATTATAPSPT